ncbi:MAG TPA: hypothetical protein ENI87_14065 [bacterium]|nr:hypothetical protein [bacterium]
MAPGFDRREKGELSLHATGDLDGIYVNTGRELIAFDPLRKRIQWVSICPLRGFEDEWQARPLRRRRGGLVEPGGTINQDMVLSAAVGDDVVVAALQVPDDSVSVDFQGSLQVMNKIPQRRLFAWDRRTGRLLWSHFDELAGRITKRYRGHDACAPPLVAGDTVYAPVHDRSGAIAFSIAAYDLHTGQPKWRRLVCSSQQDVNMFGNARMEFAASPLALAGGVLFGSTNLGVAFALDAADGRVRWVSAYDVVSMPKAMLHGQLERQVFFANNAPVVCDGVVCLTPLDSQAVLGLDVDSGAALWRLPFDARIGGIENRVQWLCGTIDDEFVLSGAGVVAVRARPDNTFGRAVVRQLVRPDQIDGRRLLRIPARPAVTEDAVFVPTLDRVLAFDRTGMPAKPVAELRCNGLRPGNLMLVDGVVASLRNRSFGLLLDVEALLARSQAAVRAQPDDPAALLRLASLRKALLTDDAPVAESAAVQELFRRGLTACIERGLPPNHPTRIALQKELYAAALAVAEAAELHQRSDVLDRYASARELAPDLAHWLEVQSKVLQHSRGDRKRLLRELERLERRAPAAEMPELGVPVATFVLWQRALAFEHDPPRAIALWQQLLERHGQTTIGGDTAARLAEAAIARLITAHGPKVYAAIDARANEALRAAGSDRDALAALTRRFPNSAAAREAGIRLLDRAVEDGDLGVACQVLGRAIRTGTVSPGVLRRVQVAAGRRGNAPLVRAMARRLRAHDEPSDWPADAGRTFAAVARADADAAGPPEPASTAVQLPRRVLLRVRPRSRQEYVRAVDTRIGKGFPRKPDTPIYVVAGSELVAFDIDAEGGQRQLFATPVEFLEHVIVCGDTLLVPDMERLFALDYRSGELRWELEFEQPRLIESLGITTGVMHVSAQPSIPDGNSELIGIEPLTGTRLFTSSLGGHQFKPKPIADQLLLLSLGKTTNDPPTVTRLDPITGTALRRIPLRRAVGPDRLQLNRASLATRLYPQGISGDQQRIYLPVDGRMTSAEPQVFALDDTGDVRWQWQGNAGSTLLLAQRRGTRFVVVEANEQRSSRVVVLAADDGSVVQDLDVGVDANVLNWERSWLDNPAPTTLLVSSFVDRASRARQLVCVGVTAGPSFALPLAPDDGDIMRTPQFGDGFVTFGVRPRRSNGDFRLYAIDLQTRRGAFAGGIKHHGIAARGAPHGMSAVGPYTVLSTTQGLILLADGPREDR